MATRTNESTFVKADGFVNLQVTDKSGNKHSFKVGIPLHGDRALDKAVLANPELLVTALTEGRISLSVYRTVDAAATVVNL